jgi:integrase
MKSRLTDVLVRNLPPPDKGQQIVFDTSLPSFGVRVSQGGTKSWIVVQSSPKRFVTIGRFPALPLARARHAARLLIAEKVLGRLQPRRISFDTAKSEFLDDAARRNKPRTVADYTRLLRHFRFGATTLADIEKRDIVARLKLPPSEAAHALAAATTFFRWCVRHDYLERSPCEGLQPPHKHIPRERVLSDDELGAVFRHAMSQPFPRGPLVRLLILTGLRRSNCATLRWEYFDEHTKLVTLPAAVTKNSRRHVMPFGNMVSDVLAGLPRTGDFLFPAAREHVGGRPSTTFNSWSKAKAAFDDDLQGVAPYTIHDLRRTFASGLQRLGVRLETIEQLLGHVSGSRAGVIGIYQRYNFLPEQRDAIYLWEAKLDGLLTDGGGGKRLD